MYILISILVLIGVAALGIAMIANRKPGNKKYPKGHYMGLGIGMGMALGMPIGIFIGILLDKIPTGIAIGPSLGAGIGTAIGASLENKFKNRQTPLSSKEKTIRKWVLAGVSMFVVISIVFAISLVGN